MADQTRTETDTYFNSVNIRGFKKFHENRFITKSSVAGKVTVGLASSWSYLRHRPKRFTTKFHYTGPTGPDPTRQSPRTLSETRADPADFVWTGPVWSGLVGPV